MSKYAAFGLLAASFAFACGEDSTASSRAAQSAPQSPLGTSPSAFAKANPTFDHYWYAGLAELGRYDLEQMRYGEKRSGHAVLVYVTEDFRLDRRVKYEGGDRDNVASVLKLNAHRSFETGVYPYSVLTSTFSEVARMNQPVKVSASVQEWCGHTYSQLGRVDTGYDFELHSYFDREGDKEASLEASLSEDGLWTMARTDPKQLPTGTLNVLPALHVLRFRHVNAEARMAEASLREVTRSPHGTSKQFRYELHYRDFGRRLVIYFEADFPYRPLAWEESDATEGVGTVTRAIRREEMMLDYWNHNELADARYRQALGM